jgi:hypothetical protein
MRGETGGRQAVSSWQTLLPAFPARIANLEMRITVLLFIPWVGVAQQAHTVKRHQQ